MDCFCFGCGPFWYRSLEAVMSYLCLFDDDDDGDDDDEGRFNCL